MSLNSTPKGERVSIGIFGNTNSGKSSLINAVTSQSLSIVSEIKGTTTDPVSKAMELLPIGPVVIYDTPGLDDFSTLGEKRIEKAYEVLDKSDIVVLVVDAVRGFTKDDEKLIETLKERKTPYILVFNKIDLTDDYDADKVDIAVSSVTGQNINELKELIAKRAPKEEKKYIVSDLIKENDKIILVIPIDKAAPKGRLILPQQQTIRDILDAHAVAVTCQDINVRETIESLKEKPRMVITDSQAFGKVAKDVPEDIELTSFSILFARYKGELDPFIEGIRAIESLKDGDTVLISEGCTHHRQCGDIGTEKIPKLLRKHTGKKIDIRFTSGNEFPRNLDDYSLVIHCGGCMLNAKEMKSRIHYSVSQNTPIINYGMFLAYVNGILPRAMKPLGISF